jgi:hypothetical protein
MKIVMEKKINHAISAVDKSMVYNYQVILRFRWSLLIRNTFLHLNLSRTYPDA